MPKPIKRIVNAETNEVIDREMTDEEYAIFLAENNAIQNEIEARAEKLAAKALLLEKLGISEEEAKLLLS